MAGRKTKYSPERVVKIVEGLKGGLTKRAAGSLGGISEDTLLLWVNRYSDFAAQVTQAENEAEVRFASVIDKAAFGHEATTVTRITRETKDGPLVEERIETHWEYDWRAALEWLKRRRRGEWSDLEKGALPDLTGAGNYFLTLIQVAQQHGLSSIIGARDFLPSSAPPTPGLEGTNGSTNGKHD